MAYLFGDANAPSAGKMSGMMCMNRCPTVAEAIEILEAGVPEADRGATNVNQFSGDTADFEGGTVGGWAAEGSGTDIVLSVESADPIFGTYSLKVEALSGVSPNGRIWTLLGEQMQPGEQWDFEFWIKSDSPKTIDQIVMRFSTDGSSSGANETTLEDIAVSPAARKVSFSYTAGILARTLWIQGLPEGVYILDGFKQFRKGVTFDLPPSSLQLSPGLWLDESGNGGHPVLPDGMRIGAPKTEGVLFAENEFTASAVGQPICADVPVLPADCQLTLMMKATVEATFNIGDGSVADYYASGVTIGTGWAPVALSEHASDGTNRKIVVTPTASYSGVVSTKVKVEMLE